MKPGYRELIIQSAQRNDHEYATEITFQNSGQGFDLNLKATDAWLRNWNINPSYFISGRKILIKGKFGNEDHAICGFDLIEDLKLVP